MAFKKFANIVDLSTMYYPSILLCTVLLYFLGGKQRKVRVGNDPLRHLSFGRRVWMNVWCKVQNRLQFPWELIGRRRLRKTTCHRHTTPQDGRKVKNNPDEVQPTSQPELNSVKLRFFNTMECDQDRRRHWLDKVE